MSDGPIRSAWRARSLRRARRAELRTRRPLASAAPDGSPEVGPEDASPAKPKANDPEKLLNAANGASGSARSAWLAFMGLIAYLLVTLAGVDHVALLLNSPVRLPIVNVDIPLFSFFLVTPYLLVLVHLSLLIQHALLARKYQLFSEAIAADEDRRERDHPLRQLVSTYVFAQMVAGPRPIGAMQFLMRLMVFVTFSLLPVVTLLYFQVTFLPVHDVVTIHFIRVAIVLDLILLFVVRPLIPMPYLREGGKVRVAGHGWRWEMSYASLSIAGVLCLVVAAFSWLVATVPEACFWPAGDKKIYQPVTNRCFSLDQMAAEWWRLPADGKLPKLGLPITDWLFRGEQDEADKAQPTLSSAEHKRKIFAPTEWLFEGEPDPTTGQAKSWFSRNLVVIDKDLVDKTEFEDFETSLSLRGRDLRFAAFDRSDLHRSDLFNADLRGASAENANLEEALLEGARMQKANLTAANMKRSNLIGAQMQEADLSATRLQGAQMREAHLQGAVIVGTELQGTELVAAELQGAMIGEANLQGANLSHAHVEGAKLYALDMRGADLWGAHLQGTDLRGVDLGGADLTEAQLWLTAPPGADPPSAILKRFDFKPAGQRSLEEALDAIRDEQDRAEARAYMASLFDPQSVNAWENTPEYENWRRMESIPGPTPEAFAAALADLACDDSANSEIIRQIAWRFVSPVGAARDYAASSAAKLVDVETCPNASHIHPSTMARLKELAAGPRTAE